jgi:hypothetical protein
VIPLVTDGVTHHEVIGNVIQGIFIKVMNVAVPRTLADLLDRVTAEVT